MVFSPFLFVSGRGTNYSRVEKFLKFLLSSVCHLTTNSKNEQELYEITKAARNYEKHPHGCYSIQIPAGGYPVFITGGMT